MEYGEYGDSIDENEVVSNNSSAVINKEIRSAAILKDFLIERR